jgi:hypothetical protein
MELRPLRWFGVSGRLFDEEGDFLRVPAVTKRSAAITSEDDHHLTISSRPQTTRIHPDGYFNLGWALLPPLTEFLEDAAHDDCGHASPGLREFPPMEGAKRIASSAFSRVHSSGQQPNQSAAPTVRASSVSFWPALISQSSPDRSISPGIIRNGP